MANGKSEQILEEMVDLSVRTIRLVEHKRIPANVKDQLIRAVTSIGANFSEAQDASSRKDFLNKIYIAKKEAFEAKYWLSIITKLHQDDREDIMVIATEVQKFLMMLQKIINTSREGNRK